VTQRLRGKVDRQYTIAEVAEMRRKNAQLMAPRFDAHILEYSRYDHDLFQIGIVAPKAKRGRAPQSPAQKAGYKKIMQGLQIGARAGGHTLRYITRQQNFGRATNWSPVRTVRG
jgi:hypothetical protein